MPADPRQDLIVRALEAIELPRPDPGVWVAIEQRLRPREPFMARWWPSLAGAALAGAAGLLLLIGGADPRISVRSGRPAPVASGRVAEVTGSALAEDRVVVAWYAEASGTSGWALSDGSPVREGDGSP